jgi:hypothetical protein
VGEGVPPRSPSPPIAPCDVSVHADPAAARTVLAVQRHGPRLRQPPVAAGRVPQVELRVHDAPLDHLAPLSDPRTPVIGYIAASQPHPRHSARFGP